MYVRKKMRNRILIFAVVVLGFIYWRGMKIEAKERNLDCAYHVVYSYCTSAAKQPQLPGVWDILKSGANFKK